MTEEEKKEKRRAYYRAYEAAHKEARAAAYKRYRETHADDVKARRRARYQKEKGKDFMEVVKSANDGGGEKREKKGEKQDISPGKQRENKTI